MPVESRRSTYFLRQSFFDDDEAELSETVLEELSVLVVLPFESVTSSEMIRVITCVDENVIDRQPLTLMDDVLRSVDRHGHELLMDVVLSGDEEEEERTSR